MIRVQNKKKCWHRQQSPQNTQSRSLTCWHKAAHLTMHFLTVNASMTFFKAFFC